MMGRKLNALFIRKPIWPWGKIPEHDVSSRRLSRKKQKRKAWRQRRLRSSSNLLCPETIVTSFHGKDDAKVFNWHGARTIKNKLTPKTSHHCTADGTIRNGTVTPNIGPVFRSLFFLLFNVHGFNTPSWFRNGGFNKHHRTLICF